MSFSSSAHFPSVASYPVAPTEAQDVTNVEKLSLSPATAIGTSVSASDGFVLTNDPAGENGTFLPNGTSNGKIAYAVTYGAGNFRITWNGSAWVSENGTFSNDDVEFPWLGTDAGADHAGYVMTHAPILQQLAAVSTAQGGVFVDVLGVCPIATGDGLFNGKVTYQLLGNAGGFGAAYSIGYGLISGGFAHDAWHINDNGGDPLYYSLSDVATPDIATDWKNASDDTPASIMVMSVTAGDLTAGFKIGGVTFQVSGNLNGRNQYVDVLGVADPIGWQITGALWQDANDVQINHSNVAFPWLGTPEVTVTKSNVATEENWIEATSIPQLFPATAHF